MNEFDEVAEEFDSWSEKERDIYIKGICFGMNYIAGFNAVGKPHEKLTLPIVNNLLDDWAEMPFENFKEMLEKLTLCTIASLKQRENIN